MEKNKRKTDMDDYQALKDQHQDLLEEYQKLLQAKEAAESSIVVKSDFLAKMSHDLRTPLHAILSYSRFGIDKIERIDKDKIIKYFTNIEDSGKKLQEMLDAIVDLSKLESGRMVFQMFQCNPALMIDAVIRDHQILLDERQLQIEKHISQDTSALHCDQNKLSRAIATILSSAIEHSEHGSTISIKTQAVTLNGDQTMSGLKISVSDQRSAPVSKEITENFASVIDKARLAIGKGDSELKMAIAYEILTYHHGYIEAENNPSGGATYSLVLPCSLPSPT